MIQPEPSGPFVVAIMPAHFMPLWGGGFTTAQRSLPFRPESSLCAYAECLSLTTLADFSAQKPIFTPPSQKSHGAQLPPSTHLCPTAAPEPLCPGLEGHVGKRKGQPVGDSPSQALGSFAWELWGGGRWHKPHPHPMAHSFHEHNNRRKRSGPSRCQGRPPQPPQAALLAPTSAAPLPMSKASLAFLSWVAHLLPPPKYGEGDLALGSSSDATGQGWGGGAGCPDWQPIEGQKGHRFGTIGHPGSGAWMGDIPSLPTG